MVLTSEGKVFLCLSSQSYYIVSPFIFPPSWSREKGKVHEDI
jgi:hypothetical protein